MHGEAPIKVERVDILALLAGKKPHVIKARNRYRLLTDEQQGIVRMGFERHRWACVRLGISTDPMWLAEAVEDVFRGFTR